MTQFSDFGLAAGLNAALDRAGYTTPTPIQAQAIPSVLEGRDILGIAQTGTGKTAAFALPILHRLDADRQRAPKKGCRALVLSPTRELALQIAENFKTYGQKLGLRIATVFGGVGYGKQIQELQRGVDVLIATPGRLQDHIASGHADLKATDIFVLDEADQMLDLGFLKPIKQIASGLAPKRQTLFFSATMPKEIAKLAKAFLRDPVTVSVTPQATTVERIAQRVIHVEKQKKIALLGDVLSRDDPFRAIVFTRTKRGADRVAKHLCAMGFSAAAIHGNKSQNQRVRTLADFKASKIQLLVATDIAARGIDVDDVTHVVNYDLPEVPEAYVHRIGRTARAGASGEAISFCAPDDKHLLKAIERTTRQSIPSEDRRGDDGLATVSDGQKDRAQRDRFSRDRKTSQGARRANGNAGGRADTRGDRRKPRRTQGRSSGDLSGGAGREAQTGADTVRENGVAEAGRYDPTRPKTKPRRKPPHKRDRAQAGQKRPRGASDGRDMSAAADQESRSGIQLRADGRSSSASSRQTTGEPVAEGLRNKRKKNRSATLAKPTSAKPTQGKNTNSRAARKKMRSRSQKPQSVA
ncbi:MAG: DEAD/DEAH box helicase [Pseudomonadota bacterium]